MPGQLISVQAALGLLSHVRPGTHQLHGRHLLAQPRFSAWPGSIKLTAVLWQPRLPDPACIARTFKFLTRESCGAYMDSVSA